MTGTVLRLYAARVAHVAAGVASAVAVEEFDVRTRPGHPDPVRTTGHRREVDDGHREALSVARAAHERHHAVLDPQCRSWSHPELFVADASFMPTSLGVGPALTVIANALRIGEILCSEF